MVDITQKSNTLRIAEAHATVNVSKQETINAILNKTVPKGDVFAMSKAAGLLGVKKTPEILPDCHPLPIEYTGIEYEINGLSILIKVKVKTIYKTGVEVEAMHGASIVALNLYDMLKPIDKEIEIGQIKLHQKMGGKTSYPFFDASSLKASIFVCSDSISQGKANDSSGKAIQKRLEEHQILINKVEVIADEKTTIQNRLKESLEQSSIIIFTGGTGVAPRDVTPEAILPYIEKRMNGVEETLRRYGQERMPYAMLSRSVVGTIGNSVVMALPGSTKGVEESLDATLPYLFHTFSMLKGEKH